MGDILIRKATLDDYFQLMSLFENAYAGNYSDETVTNHEHLKASLTSSHRFWAVAEVDSKLVGAMIFTSDFRNELAKITGAVVDRNYRKHGVAETVLQFGLDEVRKNKVGSLYGLVRTVSSAPQRLTQHFGFKIAGVFPNVHLTDKFETNCLSLLIPPEVLAQRNTDFFLHEGVFPIYELVRSDFDLAPLPKASTVPPVKDNTVVVHESFEFEEIHAEVFVGRKFQELEEDSVNPYEFFNRANLLLVSKGMDKTEVYCHYAKADQSCIVLFMNNCPEGKSGDVMNCLSKQLQRSGIRYLEYGCRASEFQKIDSAIKSGFIPSAYFPAFQKAHGKRHDFVFFSKSFETFSFGGLQLNNRAQVFLDYYLDFWAETNLGDWKKRCK